MRSVLFRSTTTATVSLVFVLINMESIKSLFVVLCNIKKEKALPGLMFFRTCSQRLLLEVLGGGQSLRGPLRF